MLMVSSAGGDAGHEHTWEWPTALPARFADRCVPSTLRTWEGGVTTVCVGSSPHAVPVVRARSDMMHHGVWVTDADFEPQGGIPDLGIEARACVFGIPIHSRAAEAWARVASHLPPSDVNVVAVYHGTDAEHVPSIQATGLQPAHGMLGTAVSVGTFWKATRYASRTQDYKLRKQGVIVRAYLEPGACKHFDGQGAGCACATCVAHRARIRALIASCGMSPLYDCERTRIADHLGTWMATYDTAYVGVIKASDAEKGARAMYANKNAEYAVARPHERLELQCMALLDMRSVDAPHWNPLQRTQCIL